MHYLTLYHYRPLVLPNYDGQLKLTLVNANQFCRGSLRRNETPSPFCRSFSVLGHLMLKLSPIIKVKEARTG